MVKEGEGGRSGSGYPRTWSTPSIGFCVPWLGMLCRESPRGSVAPVESDEE